MEARLTAAATVAAITSLSSISLRLGPSVVVRGQQNEPAFRRRLGAVALRGGSVFLRFVPVWSVIG